jgi:hypothetical protein
MIRKSIILCLILFIVYELFLRVANIHWDTSQNDKAENVISAQDFIFNYPAKEISGDTVILGTSVSRKLVTDSLGKHFINLGFNAWSSYDGLELVKMSKKKPACLMIEMNYVKIQILQPEIVDNLKPISYYSGRLFKSLHLRNQPVGLIVGWGKNLMNDRIIALKEKKREDTALYQSNLRLNREIMNETVPDSVLNARFVKLKSLIDGFKKENVGILFFEIPVSKELENTASMLAVRRFFNAYFPKNEYQYIPRPAENDYVYSDGVHLSLGSALDYTLDLRKELNKLGAGSRID